MQYTYSQILKHMLSSNDIAFDHVLGNKWSYLYFTKNYDYSTSIGYFLNGMFKMAALSQSMPNNPEERCKMFLDTCFKLAQEHDLIAITFSSLDGSVSKSSMFIKQGSTIEQVLIEIDLKVA